MAAKASLFQRLLSLHAGVKVCVRPCVFRCIGTALRQVVDVGRAHLRRYMRVQKKLREIRALEDKQKAGEELAANQVREPTGCFLQSALRSFKTGEKVGNTFWGAWCFRAKFVNSVVSGNALKHAS